MEVDPQLWSKFWNELLYSYELHFKQISKDFQVLLYRQNYSIFIL